jgi:hypothetical protein
MERILECCSNVRLVFTNLFGYECRYITQGSAKSIFDNRHGPAIRLSSRSVVPMCVKAQNARLILVLWLVFSLSLEGCASRTYGLSRGGSEKEPGPMTGMTEQREATIDTKASSLDLSANEKPLKYEANPNQNYKWIDYSRWPDGRPVLVVAGTAIAVVGICGLAIVCAAASSHPGSYSAP